MGVKFGAVDELRGEGVSFDVAAEGEEVLIALDGEGFEAALVEVAVADGAVGDAPAHGVGVGEPAEEVGDLGGGGGADDEVPVVGHEAEGEDGEWDTGVGFEEDALEGGEVGGFFEEGDAAGGAVEDVVGVAFGGDAGASWHEGECKRGDGAESN